jgi:hypothetical protein
MKPFVSGSILVENFSGGAKELAIYRKNEDNRRRCDGGVAEFMSLRQGAGKEAQESRDCDSISHAAFKLRHAEMEQPRTQIRWSTVRF